MIKSFRLQITAWYLLLFSLLFLLFGAFLHTLLSRALQNRLDQTLSEEVNTTASMFQSELEELNGDPVRAAIQTVSEMRLRNVLLAIFEGRRLLASSAPLKGGELSEFAGRALAGTQPELLLPLPNAGPNGSRAVAYPLAVAGRTYVIVAVQTLDSIEAALHAARHVFFFALPLAILAAGIGGYLLATRSLAPLGWMAEQARRITDRTLDTRLDIGAASEELATLSASFNELLARLDRSFEIMRRFVADASHELRTPLSAIRGEADVTLALDRSPAEYKESLAIIQDEARRLSRLVEDLLNLARADAGKVQLQVRDFYLNDVLEDCCRSVRTRAAAKNVSIQCSCGEDVQFRGDEELFRRLVLNLLDNAIRYTPGGGIKVALDAEPGRLVLRVSDTGIGIPAEAAPHVFERFYRVDQARSRQDGGFGLGLAIVKWIAEAHNGTVELDSTPGAGSTFTVLLHR